MVVSLEECADLLRPAVSLNTLRRRIKEAPAGVVLEEGDHGRAYRIDFRAAAAWWQALAEQKGAASADRQRDLDLFVASVYGPGGSDPVDAQGQPITPAQRRAMAEAEMVEDKLRRGRGELVEVGPLRVALLDAVTELRKRLVALPTRFAKRHNLDREQRLALEAMIAEELDGLARDLGTPSGPADMDRAA